MYVTVGFVGTRTDGLDAGLRIDGVEMGDDGLENDGEPFGVVGPLFGFFGVFSFLQYAGESSKMSEQ